MWSIWGISIKTYYKDNKGKYYYLPIKFINNFTCNAQY